MGQHRKVCHAHEKLEPEFGDGTNQTKEGTQGRPSWAVYAHANTPTYPSIKQPATPTPQVIADTGGIPIPT